MKTNINFWSYLAHFFLEWKMFQTKIVEDIKTNIFVFSDFFLKSCSLWDVKKKHCRAEQATDENTARAHCMLDT